MATASAKAIAKIIAVWTFDADSGFRPMASAPLDPMRPMAIAGAIVPTPMTIAIANNFIDSASIVCCSYFTTFLWISGLLLLLPSL